MGSYDGAECTDLIGLFLLFNLKRIFPDECLGLYWDDGIGATVVNVRRTDFLDVLLDLNTGRISPFKKPLDQPIYVNSLSSHPPATINGIANSVNTRLSRLSSTKHEFDSIKSDYQEALKQAGYNNVLEYVNPQAGTPPGNSRNRKRNVTWFNPPFNAAVEGNITKQFNSIITRAFPRDHEYLNFLSYNSYGRNLSI